MMTRTCRININGEEFAANAGDVLLDSALLNGVDIPHDCRSGQCGSCLVQVRSGIAVGGRSQQPGMVHACQAMVLSDLEATFEAVPEVRTVAGTVTALQPLAHDVTEVTIATSKRAVYLPGQYFQVRFKGFAKRAFSPTIALDGSDKPGTARLHVKLVPGGHVSSRLGTDIAVGHHVKLEGPLGSAFFRTGMPNRMVLIAGGTGFAPIWAIADAALRENSARPMVLIIGVQDMKSLYMIPALHRMSGCPNLFILPIVQDPENVAEGVRVGRPTDCLAGLTKGDVIYAAGPPAMVDVIAAAAMRAEAMLHADPFVPSTVKEKSWLASLLDRRGATNRTRPEAAFGTAI